MKRMTKDEVIARLRAHEAELRAMGIERLSLFGSVARGEAGPESDVDLVAKLDGGRAFGLMRLVRMEGSLAALLGVDVDFVREPADKPRLQAQIDRDRVRVF
jgi:uncharacterized protein